MKRSSHSRRQVALFRFKPRVVEAEEKNTEYRRIQLNRLRRTFRSGFGEFLAFNICVNYVC